MEAFKPLLITKLNDLKNELNSSIINLKSIQKQIKDINSFNETQNYSYLNSLLYPEKSAGCKIPSQIPVPSTTFQLKSSFQLKGVTDEMTGKRFGVMINPFFLANNSIKEEIFENVDTGDKYSVGYASTCWVGNFLNAYNESINAFQTIDDVYEKYRLVSASLKTKYIGSLENVSGEIGGAILTFSTNQIGGSLYEDGEIVVSPFSFGYDTLKYFDIDYALDSVFSIRSTPVEGLRMLYFPLDNSFEEYQKVFGKDSFSHKGDANNEFEIPIFTARPGSVKSGFNWFIWFDNVPEGAPFVFEMCCNFECLPKPSFLNFIPTSLNIYSLSIDLKKQILKEVQNKALDKLNN